MKSVIRQHSVSYTLTHILMGILIFIFLLFITVPLVSLFTQSSISELVSALQTESVLNCLKISAVTALCTTIIVIIFGTPLAYLNSRVNYPFKNVIDTITDLPMVLPPTVAGLALLLAFGKNGLIGSYFFDVFGIRISYTVLAVIIAQIFVSSPFYIRQARAAFEAVPVEYEHASRTLGAGFMKTFFKVTIPLAYGGLLSGIIMTFSRAIGEFGATMMFAGNIAGVTQTMPMAIYVAQNFDMNISIALAIILVIFSFGIILAVKYISSKERRKYA